MKRIPYLMLLAACGAITNAAGAAQPAPEVTLTRLDCGPSNSLARLPISFSDTYANEGLDIQLTFSCYLIKHGNEYLLWDTGQSMSAGAEAPKVSIVDQLAQLRLRPEQITYVGISHFHGDHTGQVASFPASTLLIGKGDWDIIAAPNPDPAANAPLFARWLSGGGKVEPVAQDKDVFGDGTVMMLNTPGHTPGHHILMVKLPSMGYVLLTGDLVHFRENYADNGVPPFNSDRAATLASIDRMRKIAANRQATVIIQHDERDVRLLPAFPAAAR